MKINSQDRTSKYYRMISRGDIHVIRIPHEEVRENRAEDMFEIVMVKKFPKLMIETKPQILEVQ